MMFEDNRAMSRKAGIFLLCAAALALSGCETASKLNPFAEKAVPLPGKRSSLVWVVKPGTAAELATLDEAALSRRVEERMQSMLGRVTVEQGRQAYPLTASEPARFAASRIARWDGTTWSPLLCPPPFWVFSLIALYAP